VSGSVSISDAPEQTIFIVDDDDAIRDALTMLINTMHRSVRSFSSAHAFLDSYKNESGVLLLDVRMPDMSGLELQLELAKRNLTALAVLFMSGHSDIPIAVEALKRGATNFLQKPFRDQDLLDHIGVALETNLITLKDTVRNQDVKSRMQELTPRERQVMAFISDGMANKIIALRSRVMEKMGVRSVAHLVRALERAGVTDSL